jgi:hypothetical protein
MIDQKQPENVKYFNFLGSMIINKARRTREIESRIAMTKGALNKKNLFTSKLDFKVTKYLVGCYYGAETLTVPKVDRKYLGSFEMWW